MLILSPGNLQWFNEVVASELLVLFVGGKKKNPQTFVFFLVLRMLMVYFDNKH